MLQRAEFMRNKKAFTLSEVLITLSIIGIVAAMTLPSLINKYKETVTVTKVKKIYTTLVNALELYKANNNGAEFDSWVGEENATAEAFNKYFKPYLKIAKDCGLGTNNECVTPNFVGRNNVKLRYSFPYYSVILNDGSAIWMRLGVGALFFYDVNNQKAPNKLGYDIFLFRIHKDKIVPIGMPDDYPFDTQCSKSNSSGWGCAAWVVYKGNMDYLKCDGLTWNDSKCNR